MSPRDCLSSLSFSSGLSKGGERNTRHSSCVSGRPPELHTAHLDVTEGSIYGCFLSTELCRVALTSSARAARCQESPSQLWELGASVKRLLQAEGCSDNLKSLALEGAERGIICKVQMGSFLAMSPLHPGEREGGREMEKVRASKIAFLFLDPGTYFLSFSFCFPFLLSPP